MGKNLKGRELGIGISQRKDGRYEGKYTDATGKRKSIYGKKLSDVKRQLADIKYEIEHGFYSSDCSMSVNDWFDFFMENYKVGKLAESTIEIYEQCFKCHIRPVIGFMTVRDVKPIHCQRIINKMVEDGYMFGTINLTRVTLSSIFKRLVLNDVIQKNPVKNLTLPQDTGKEARVLTLDEEETFLRYARGTVYENVYKFVLLTGLRYGEVAGLTWDCVDYFSKEISIEKSVIYSNKDNCFTFTNTKTRSSVRQVPLCKEAIEILKSVSLEKKKKQLMSIDWNTDKQFENLVFTTKNGRPCGNSNFNNAIKTIIGRINKDRIAESRINNTEYEEFKSFSLHSLRHTFATRCFESGMKPKVVQSILGHATLGITTDIYMHTTMEHVHDDFEKFKSLNIVS